MTEAEFQRAVEELCRYRGLRYYHVTRTDKRDVAGFPDLVIVGKRVIFAELKRENGKVTAAQKDWAESLRGAGQEWHLWRPSDMPMISRILHRLSL